MGLLYHGSCALASHSVVWLLERLGNLSLVSFCLLVSIFVDDFLLALLSGFLSILLISLVFIFTDEYCKLCNIPYEFHVCGCSFFLVFDLRTQAVSNEEKFCPCEALMNNLKRA